MFDRDQSGFTIFPLGQGARIILVSSSDGSDFNDGMLQPVRSLQKALSLVRNGFPDRILFKRGDVFPPPISTPTSRSKAAVPSNR